MKKLLFLFAFAISFSACASIHELKSYQDLNLNEIDENTLVVFDIDNTLLRQDSMIGTHQWGDYMRERAIKKGVPAEQAARYQHQVFGELQSHLAVVPVENKILDILTRLSQKHVPHLALTARSNSITQATLQQLQILKHDFTTSFPEQKDKNLLSDHLKGGVIFSGSTPKGELLKQIIDNSVHAPTKIIFVDDKLYNLESVEKSLANTSLALTSYRYGAADTIVSEFDSALADIEYSFYKETSQILSDHKAADLKQDLSAMTQLRFDYFLQKQGPLVQPTAACFALSPLTYRCNYVYDSEIPSSIDFEFQKETESKNLYFGQW